MERQWSQEAMPNRMIAPTHAKLSVRAQCRLLPILQSPFYDAPQGAATLNLGLKFQVQRLICRPQVPRPWLVGVFSIGGLSGALVPEAGHVIEFGRAGGAQGRALGEELAQAVRWWSRC